MKLKLIRLTLATMLFLACGATPMLADGGTIPPLCWPGRPCASIGHVVFTPGGLTQ